MVEPSMNRVLPRICLVLAFLAASVVPALAGPATQTLSTSVDKIIVLLSDPAYKDTTTRPGLRQKLIHTIEGIFDTKELSRRALGADWNKFSAQQQDSFVAAFGTLLQNTYLDKIESYTDEKVQYLGEQSLGEGKAEVTTKVIGKGKEIPIAYRLIDRGGWKVYDVVIEGVSLVQNYRSQFGQILMNETPDALIAKISAKKS
jgi:phospholipid transport system substrate-binding protein